MPLLGKALQVGGGGIHRDSVVIAVVVLGSDWVCQLPRAYGNGGMAGGDP